MKKLLTVGALAAVLGLSLAGVAKGGDGEAIFKKKMCVACHGTGKKGGDLKGSKMDKAALAKFLKDPKSGNPKSAMPAFKGTDEELAALVDYIMTLRK